MLFLNSCISGLIFYYFYAIVRIVVINIELASYHFFGKDCTIRHIGIHDIYTALHIDF